MREVMLVAVGGSLGALARYGTGIAAGHLLGRGFPWGTLAVNVAGCFVMGFVTEWTALTAPLRGQIAFWKQGVAIGFLGGLTTFSSFGADTLRQFESGHFALGLANIGANVVLSLAAIWAGISIMQAVD